MHDQTHGRGRAELEGMLDRLYAFVGIVDLSGRLAECNAPAEAVLGLARQALIGSPLADLPIWLRPDTRGRVAAFVESARAGTVCRADLPIRSATGDPALLDFQLSPLSDPDGTVIQMIAFAVDVTARHDAEAKLRASETILRGISETTKSLVFAKDEQSRFLYVNPRIPEVVGLPERDIIGRSDSEFMPRRGDGEAILANDRAVMESGKPQTYEERFTDLNGDVSYWTSTKSPMWDDEGRIVGVVGVSTEVTELKVAQAELEREVHARELLLYEVNHRVKNSLQLVTSILAIEASKIEDQRARSVLMDARRKIGHIAQLHQQLYSGGRHAGVDFAAFLRDLAGGLVAAVPERTVSLEVTGPSAQMLHIRLATPLAMLASELITNAVKHAFPAGNGRISLDYRVDGCCARLSIADDGIGLPAGIDPFHAESVGMQIVAGLLTQLRAELSWESGAQGTRYDIVVPLLGARG